MKISFLALSQRPIRIDPAEKDPSADYTRQWLIRDLIRDDPSLTPAAADTLIREAGREALAWGL